MNTKEFYRNIFFSGNLGLKEATTKETKEIDKVTAEADALIWDIFPENEITPKQKEYLELQQDLKADDLCAQWDAGVIYGMELMKALQELTSNPRKVFNSIFSKSTYRESQEEALRTIEKLKAMHNNIKE